MANLESTECVHSNMLTGTVTYLIVEDIVGKAQEDALEWRESRISVALDPIQSFPS